MITKFSAANPARVSQWNTKDIQTSSSYKNSPSTLSPVLVYTNISLSWFAVHLFIQTSVISPVFFFCKKIISLPIFYLFTASREHAYTNFSVVKFSFLSWTIIKHLHRRFIKVTPLVVYLPWILLKRCSSSYSALAPLMLQTCKCLYL